MKHPNKPPRQRRRGPNSLLGGILGAPDDPLERAAGASIVTPRARAYLAQLADHQAEPVGDVAAAADSSLREDVDAAGADRPTPKHRWNQ